MGRILRTKTAPNPFYHISEWVVTFYQTLQENPIRPFGSREVEMSYLNF